MKDSTVTKINMILCYVGDNTLDILTWHFLIFKIVSSFLVLGGELSFNMISSFPVIEQYSKNGFWILYFCAGCILPLVAKKDFLKNLKIEL